MPQCYLLKKRIFYYFSFHLATATGIWANQGVLLYPTSWHPGKEGSWFLHWVGTWLFLCLIGKPHGDITLRSWDAALSSSSITPYSWGNAGAYTWCSNLFLPWHHFLGECLHWAFRHAVAGQWELPCPPEEVISRTGNWTHTGCYILSYLSPLERELQAEEHPTDVNVSHVLLSCAPMWEYYQV